MSFGRYLGATAAAVAVAVFAFGAQAQEKKADPKAAKKAVAACNSLKEQTACEGRTDCSWVAESKDAKTGKVKKKAYCRAKPTPKKK